MAAYKAGCDTVIIPQENEKDLSEISSEVKDAVNFITVSTFDEVIDYALVERPSAETVNKITYSTGVTVQNHPTQGAII